MGEAPPELAAAGDQPAAELDSAPPPALDVAPPPAASGLEVAAGPDESVDPPLLDPPLLEHPARAMIATPKVVRTHFLLRLCTTGIDCAPSKRRCFSGVLGC